MCFPEPCGELSQTVNETVARASQDPAGGWASLGLGPASETWPASEGLAGPESHGPARVILLELKESPQGPWVPTHLHSWFCVPRVVKQMVK